MRSSAFSLRQHSTRLACCIGILLLCGRMAVTEGTANSPDRIKPLLQERLAVAREMQKLSVEMYRSGEASLDEVHQAGLALLNARLELAETQQERIEIHKEMVERAEEYEKNVSQALRAGGPVSPIDALKAKAHLLELRITLERAKTTAKELQRGS